MAHDTFELPDREVLSLIGAPMADGILSYAEATQSAPTTQTASTASNPLFGQGLTTVTDAAQNAPSAPGGATVQNVNSPNSTGIASTSSG
jgi:hypothetical protein